MFEFVLVAAAASSGTLLALFGVYAWFRRHSIIRIEKRYAQNVSGRLAHMKSHTSRKTPPPFGVTHPDDVIDADFEDIDDEVDRPISEAPAAEVPGGMMFYNPPRTMVAHVPKPVVVRIVPEGISREVAFGIASRMKSSGPVQEKEVSVTTAMAVELLGPSDSFSIKSQTPAQQVVSSKRNFAEWEWEVTALRSGTYQLELRVTCCVLVSGQLVPSSDIDPIVTPIRVTVNTTHTVSNIAKWVGVAFAGGLIAHVITVYYGPTIDAVLPPKIVDEVQKETPPSQPSQ